MSTRHHVRTFCETLNPTGITALMEQARALRPSPELNDAADTIAAIRIGGGAIAMHERNTWGEPTVSIADLPDHEAMLLTGLSLRAAARAPRRLQVRPAIQRLNQLCTEEPDFFDELLLELSRRYHVQPPFAELMRAHADALRAVEPELKTIDRTLFPDHEPGLVGSVRQWLGVGGAPDRTLRLVTALVLLDAKEPPT